MKKLLFIALAIIGLTLTFQLNNAMAFDPDKCDDWNNPDQVCIGQVVLDEMGVFLSDGSWQWNQDFVNEFNAWSNEHTIDQPRYEPRKLGITAKDTHMDLKQFSNKPSHVRVGLVLEDGGVEVPEIMRVEGPNGEQVGYFHGDYDPPDGCCDENNYCDWDSDACNQSWINLSFGTRFDGPVSTDRIGLMTWNEQSVPLARRDNSYFIAVQYDNDRTVADWHSAWEQRIIEDYFVFDDGIIPTLGPQTVTLTIDDQELTLTFNVVNIEPMPVVPATYTQSVTVAAGKSGKQVTTGQSITVNNISVREINGALIVQWAEPDLALFPDPFADRKELRMTVGRVDYFLWVEAPYQIGSIVVPDYMFTRIKNDISTIYGENRLEITFQYRLKYNANEGFDGETQNRGYSESVYLDF